jgi:hypothetical protein
MLATIHVSAGKLIGSVVAVAFWIRAKKLRTNSSGCNFAALADAVAAFWIVPKHNADALECCVAAGLAFQDDMKAVHCAANECKPMPKGGFSPVFVLLPTEDWVHLAVDGESIISVGDGH